ncbi:porin [Aliisedimentitalea scapharcae]|uniref:Porin n=1 Tax=Aliisedimentitalea scapharcae TaxID=1524259 RepID=A0ABZ2XTZ0_9RHOB
MKKILFATTALIATAGMAAADVRISGYGRFGLDYNENNDRVGNIASGALNGRSETNITSRLRLQFDMSTETDSGVTLGARFRAQAESRDNAPGGAAFNGARFFATYEGFTLQVGNIIGAVENATGLYLETRTAGVGIDGAGFESIVTNVNGESFNWDAYSSAGVGANGVEVLYAAGAFSGHISYSEDNGLPTSASRVAANMAYTFGDWTGAIAVQDSDLAFEDKTFVSISGDLGQFGVRLAYADNDGIDKWGLYGNMDIGSASNILVYVTDEDAVSAADVVAGRNDNRDAIAGSNNREGTGYGIHYSYDLGGGASFEAGIRESSWDNTTVQAGVYFSF